MEKEIMRIIGKIIGKGVYTYYGIRFDNKKYNVGDFCQNSRQWWQDDPQDGSKYVPSMCAWDGGELNGTCAHLIDPETVTEDLGEARQLYGYYDNAYLIAGDIAEYGNDNREIIIEDAVVVMLLAFDRIYI